MAEPYIVGSVDKIAFTEEGKIRIVRKDFPELEFDADKTRLFVRDIKQLQWDIPMGFKKHRNLILMESDSVCDVDPDYGGMNLIFCGQKPIIRTWL